jgi:hypothetical protein
MSFPRKQASSATHLRGIKRSDGFCRNTVNALSQINNQLKNI